MNTIEPFGYFRPTIEGWEDCDKDDVGARPLYEIHKVDALEVSIRTIEWLMNPVNGVTYLLPIGMQSELCALLANLPEPPK